MPTPYLDGSPTSPGPYRKLVSTLARRAARMGSRDPEGAAQEAVLRSLAHASSGPALEYYFREQLPVRAAEPVWTLAHLLGWLHGVLRFVVWEDRARASTRRETAAALDDLLAVPDPGPTQLESVIDAQFRVIVQDCLTRLNTNHRAALVLRLQGAKYDQIARHLGVSGNTVATWLRRGSHELIQHVREQIGDRGDAGSSKSCAVPKVSHA